MKHSEKLKILFLCTGNSCRSQMAEGWARKLKSDSIEPYSAGTHPGKLDTKSVHVMAEAGVDIANQQPKGVDDVKDIVFDYVVTVCDQAREACPYFPARIKLVHVGFDDPPHLAANIKDEQKVLSIYRRVRDEIRIFVEKLPEILENNK
ncbi:MAG: arsenate reductase ArsC [Sedimentisphaerales bacterium]